MSIRPNILHVIPPDMPLFENNNSKLNFHKRMNTNNSLFIIKNSLFTKNT